MKKLMIFSVFIAAILAQSCRKADNPKLPDLIRVPTPQIVKEAGSDQVISAQDPDAFVGKFTVGMFFETDEPAQSMDVVVIKNDDKTNVKTIQANVTTFPTTVTITGPQLETLFGAPIVLGDKYDISVNVTTRSGAKYEGFPAVGNAYASGVASQPGASTLIRYEAVCKYDPSIYQGNFVVVQDDWADYSVGEVVELTRIDDTHFSFQYKAADPKPIIVTVNPNTNAVTVAKQVYGSGYPPGWTFGDVSVETVTSINNAVAPCDQSVTMVLTHSVSAGTFSGGPWTITLKKQ